MDTADLYCQLPAPGSEEYTRTYPGASASGGAAVASSPDGSAIVAGVLDGRMALWRLDPEGDVAAGWPKTMANWTMDPELAAKESTATAVSVDATGAIFVGGTVKSGITTRRYLAKLSDQGERLWEDPGLKDGEEISALATSAAGDTVAAGSVRTSPLDQPPAYDSGTWGYPKQGIRSWSDVFMQPDTDPHPDDQEQATASEPDAVLALPDGDFMVFGEREYKDDWDSNLVHPRDQHSATRATAPAMAPCGPPTGLKYKQRCRGRGDAHRHAGFTAAGWCRHDIDGWRDTSGLRARIRCGWRLGRLLCGAIADASRGSCSRAGPRAQTRDRRLLDQTWSDRRMGLLIGWSRQAAPVDADL
jgi:hypothetical protein